MTGRWIPVFAEPVLVASLVCYVPAVICGISLDHPKALVGRVVFPVRPQEELDAHPGDVQREGVVRAILHRAVLILLDVAGVQRPAHSDPGSLGIRGNGFVYRLAAVV